LAQLGDTRRAQELREAARRIRKRFVSEFWREEKRLVAMALDGHRQPAEVMSSNAGQVLWSGLLGQAQAGPVKDALFASDMFSGWGIRTLSYRAPSYYPLGYHLGTVWPHDNGMIALGLKRYGFDNEVNEIATSLLDAAREFPSYRLPELFGGQPRSEFQPPVPYPVACRPQTWTAGCQLHLLQAMLGLHADGLRKRLLVIRPRLPYWLTQMHIAHLRVGEGSVNLHFRTKRGKTSVTYETAGPVSVEVKANSGAFFSE
jgi:glycogen debranching enzyme